MASRRTAGVVMPPPILFGLGVAGGVVCGMFVPLAWPATMEPVREPAGWIIAAVGFVLIGWSAIRFTDAGTPVQPHHPTTALVTGGPYAVSRNPIYLALIAITLGASLISALPWIAVMLAPTVAALHAGVIKREEAYLEKLFGDEYRAYKAKVRRYL